MSVFVVDASVGIKWFIPEVHTPDALRLRDPIHELHVPAFFDIETANILWKKIRRNELNRVDADAVIAQLSLLPLVRHADDRLLTAAFDLADETERTVYDCLYLALAVQLQEKMVTADLRLLNALAGTPWGGHVCTVQNVP